MSECLANFEYVGRFNAILKEKKDSFIELNSIIPLSSLRSKDDLNIVLENRKYLKSRLPLEFSVNRELLKSGDFIFETNGLSSESKPTKYYSIKELNENIVLF